MISYGAIRARQTVLTKNYNLIDAEWQKVKDLPDDEQTYPRKLEIMGALHVMKGRLLECEVWLEWGEKFPHIERPDQLPTEGNMLRHDAISDIQTEAQAFREREALHRGNADQLSASLPDLAV
jgi:hypothetical protein